MLELILLLILFSFIFVFMFPIGAKTVNSLLSTIELSKAYLATHLIPLTHSSAVEPVIVIMHFYC